MLAEGLELAAASRIALSDLELWVAEHARQRIFVHAGCVAYDGRAIVLPGRTFSGKSTLTAALLRAGADYLSDEYAVFDGAGYVHPYARPLSLRREQGLEAERLPPGAIGAAVCEQRIRVAIVAGLHYDANLEAALDVEQLPAGRGLMKLLDNSPSARSRPAQTLATLARAVKPAIAIRGLRGEADAAAASVLALL